MAEQRFSLSNKRVWVAGHRGMVGSAVMRRLAQEDCEVLTVDRSQVDLRRQDEVEQWMRHQRPDSIFLCAATVGGIVANDARPAEFLYDNLIIEANVIKAAADISCQKLLFLGSSCIYPKHAPQPIPEEALLSGPLESTNQWYAIAKIAGLKLCESYRKQFGLDFITAMPSNLYGPGDNFDLTSSHVIPAIMRKAHEAKLSGSAAVEVWGTGKPRREFLHVDDLADALVFLMSRYSDPATVNVGVGSDLTIAELAETVCEVVGYRGMLSFNVTKPDGTSRKLLDVSKLDRLGWKATISLRDGLAQTYEWFLKNASAYRGRSLLQLKATA